MTQKTVCFVLSLLLLLSAGGAGAAQTASTDKDQITHVLNRLGFGPRPGDLERVRELGLQQYIEQQLHPEQIDDSLTEDRLRGLPSLHLSVAEVYRQYPNAQQVARQMGIRNRQAEADRAATRTRIETYFKENGLRQPQRLLQELQSQKILRAVYSERQLQEVMTDFWFNHFNVYWGKGADRWLTTDFEMNAIRPHALGKFKDLVAATAKSPAMLFYLDNYLSAAPGPLVDSVMRAAGNRRLGINENYARELMELHTMGVDGGFTQKDVQEVARAFTGWTIQQPRQRGEFMFRPMMHDRGEKVVLGQTIKAGGGIDDGQRVIEILTAHPSTARFIATKLVQRFVSDTPPQALIDRVAATYTRTDGSIQEMLRVIFLSDEFMSPKAYGQKTKSAFEFVASAIRALDGQTNGSAQVARMITQMGQPLYQYQPPTGFPDRADFWMNNGTLLERINFAIALASDRVPGTSVNITAFSDAKAASQFLGSPEFQKR